MPLPSRSESGLPLWQRDSADGQRDDDTEYRDWENSARNLQDSMSDIHYTIKMQQNYFVGFEKSINNLHEKMALVETSVTSLSENHSRKLSSLSEKGNDRRESPKTPNDADFDAILKNSLRPIESELACIKDSLIKELSLALVRYHGSAVSAKPDSGISPTHFWGAEDQSQLRSELASFKEELGADIREYLVKLVGKPRAWKTDHEYESPKRGSSDSSSPSAIGVLDTVEHSRCSKKSIDTLSKAKRDAFQMVSAVNADVAEAVNQVVDDDDEDENDDDDEDVCEKRTLGRRVLSGISLKDSYLDDVDCYKTEGWAQAVVRCKEFTYLTSFLISLQALYIGFETSLNTHDNLYDADLVFLLFSQSFCSYFTIELILRFVAFRDKSTCWRDGWFVFDAVLVLLNCLDLWVFMVLGKIGNKERNHPSVVVNTALLLRVLRVCRVLRLMQVFPELGTMTKGLIRAFSAVFATMMFIGFMMYTWGIFLHMLLKDKTEVNENLSTNYGFEFTTFFDVIWLLLLDGVLQLDNSALIMTSLIYGESAAEILAGIGLTLFSLLASLMILQMLIGLLCDICARISKDQHGAAALELVKQELYGALRQNDDGDGKVSSAELLKVLDSTKATNVFKRLRVNRPFFGELAKLLYSGDADANVPIHVILDLLVLCRGENATTVDILATAISFLTKELADMEQRIITSRKA